MGMQKVNILGAEYEVIEKKYDEDAEFAKNGCNGYCDWSVHQIVICEMTTYRGYENETKAMCDAEEKQTLRHEVVHAFFNESGLMANASKTDKAWPLFEECVDWIAIQGPKIYKVWEELGCLP